MKFTIKHEIRGRIRIHNCQKTMSADQADELQYYLITKDFVTSVKIYDRTNDIVICYDASRSEILTALKEFYHGIITVPDNYQESQSRQLNQTYQEKLISKVLFHYGNKLLFPYPLRAGITVIKSLKYIYEGIHTLAQGKIEVPVLDGTAIGVSIIRRDINTASSIMFLLGIGEILEEWTHKKSVDDLAKSMSLNIDKVWKVEEDHEILVPSNEIDANDIVHIQMGNMIPFDGVVVDGEAMVNQASLTGESTPVRKIPDGYVYAGTVVEEGDLKVCVKEVNGSSKFDKIVTMIEESEKLKSSLESKAEHLADRLVPYTLAGTALTYLFTRNVTKALSVLMVDFSCALKLAMPISVLSAIREASNYHVTVKGGRYLEAMAEADTIVFDKTGTLTKGVFEVSGVHHNTMPEDKVLEYAALAECYSSHPISKSLKNAYGKEINQDRVTNVEEISGNGVTAMVDGVSVAVGNAKLMKKLGVAYSDCHKVGTLVHVAVDGAYAGHILISDVVKPHSKEAIAELKKAGVKKLVMLTGDADRVAQQVAGSLGIDKVYSELLPAQKVEKVEELLTSKSEKDKLAFVGDGINDAPVLSRADIGIAMGALGSDAAIEAADIVLMDDDPLKIVKAIRISKKCMRIVYENIYFAIGIKILCLILGAVGIANMWLAIFADVGVMVIAVLNAIRVLFVKKL